MSRNDGNSLNIPLMAGSLAALGFLAVFIYMDEDLRNRLKEQISTLLDATGKMVDAASSLSKKLSGTDNEMPAHQVTLESQWEAVEAVRRA